MNLNTSKERIVRFSLSFTNLAPMLLLALMRKFGVLEEEAQDIIDETLVSFLEQIQASEEQELFEQMKHEDLVKYLSTAVTNRYRDRLKHRRVIERSAQELLFALEGTEAPTPESAVLQRERVRRLHTAVCKLKKPYRQIFTALLCEDITLAQIARENDMNIHSIYKQFQRGLDALQKVWELQKEPISGPQTEINQDK